MNTWFSLIAFHIILSFLSCTTMAKETKHFFQSSLVQEVKFSPNKEGGIFSLKHSTGKVSNSSNTGNFSYSLPIALPSKRAPILYNPIPEYSSSGSLSEFGRGFSSKVQISRTRKIGLINFSNKDNLSTPFGIFEYSKSYKKWILVSGGEKYRLKIKENNTIEVEQHKGRTFIFKSFEKNKEKTKFWYLTNISSIDGNKSLIDYNLSKNDFPTINEIKYAYINNKYQYKLKFFYRRNKNNNFYSYLNSSAYLLRRDFIKKIVVSNLSEGNYIPTQEYVLKIEDIKNVGGDYLTKLTSKIIKDNNSSNQFYLNFSYDQLRKKRVKWSKANELDFLSKRLGSSFMDYDNVGLSDINSDGIMDIELATKKSFFLGGKSYEPSPTKITKENKCFNNYSLKIPSKSRTLVSLFPGKEKVYALKTNYRYETNKTTLRVCDIYSDRSESIQFTGDWVLGTGKTLIADLNNDQKPDFVTINQDKVQVLINQSTEENFIKLKFSKMKSIKLSDFTGSSSFQTLINDINGDGLVDLILVYQTGFNVYFGKLGKGFLSKSVSYRFFRDFSKRDSVSNLNSGQIAVRDLNSDGLADVFIKEPHHFSVYFNKGKYFELSDFTYTALDNDKIYSYSFPMYYPGEKQGNVIYRSSANKIERSVLIPSSLGRMSKIEDSRGHVINIKYYRPSITRGSFASSDSLRNICKKNIENKNFKCTYFIHKEPIRNNYNQFKGYKILESLSDKEQQYRRYKNYDNEKIHVQEIKTIDRKFPEFMRVDKYELDLSDEESPKIIVKSKESFFQSSDSLKPVSYIKTNYFNDKNCTYPQEIITSEGVLSTKINYLNSDHFSCYVKTKKYVGTHRNTNFDFKHQLDFVLDPESKRPIEIYSNNSLIQKIKYDANNAFQVQSIENIDGKKVDYQYDQNGRIYRSSDNQDFIGEIVYQDHLDLAKIMEQKVGKDDFYIQNYKYDKLNRLEALGDNAKSTLNSFYTYFSYILPTKIKTGLMTQTSIHDIEKKQVSKYFISVGSSGEKFANIYENEYGRFISGASFFDNKTKLKKNLFDIPINGFTFDVNLLHVNNNIKSESYKSPLFQEMYIKSSIDGTQNKVQNVSLDTSSNGNLLLINNTLGKENARVIELDAQGLTYSVKDENDFTYYFKHDLLKRLRKVTLPNGEKHLKGYNNEGLVSSVGRDNIGIMNYEYYPNLLLKSKIFTSDSIFPDRQENFTYLKNGKIDFLTYSSKNKKKSFSFRYNGETCDKYKVKNQLAKLTSICSDDLDEEFIFKRSGLKVETRTRVKNKYITEKWSYDHAKNVKGFEVKHKNEVVGVYKQLDLYGRVSSLKNHLGETIIEAKYNSKSKLSTVLFPQLGYKIIYHYDRTNEFLTGKSFEFEKEKEDYFFYLNQVGNINRVQFNSDKNGFDYIYEYFENDMLKKAKEKSTESFSLEEYFNSNFETDNFIKKVSLGANGRIQYYKNLEYLYNSNRQIKAKLRDNDVDEIYFDWGLYSAQKGLLMKVKVSNHTVGILTSKGLIPIKESINKGQISSSLSVFGKNTQDISHRELLAMGEVGFDSDLGLYRMQQRFYNPKTKKFISFDPLFFENPEKCLDSPVECDLFSYAKNNPLSNIDSSGESAEAIFIEYTTAELGNLAHAIKFEVMSAYKYLSTFVTEQTITGLGGKVSTPSSFKPVSASFRLGYDSVKGPEAFGEVGYKCGAIGGSGQFGYSNGGLRAIGRFGGYPGKTGGDYTIGTSEYARGKFDLGPVGFQYNSTGFGRFDFSLGNFYGAKVGGYLNFQLSPAAYDGFNQASSYSDWAYQGVPYPNY